GKVNEIERIDLIPARPTDFPDTPGFGFPLRFKVEAGNDPSFKAATVLSEHTQSDFQNPGDTRVKIDGRKIHAEFIRVTATELWPRTNDFVFALGEIAVMSAGKNVAAGAKVSAMDSIEAGRWSTKYLVDGFSSRNALPDLSDPTIATKEAKREAIE